MAEVEPPYGDGPTGDYSWSVAGYYDIDTGEYRDREGDDGIPWNFTDWEFLGDSDSIVVRITTDSGDYYTTIAGPFDDPEDFEVAIHDWWESGSG